MASKKETVTHKTNLYSAWNSGIGHAFINYNVIQNSSSIPSLSVMLNQLNQGIMNNGTKTKNAAKAAELQTFLNELFFPKDGSNLASRLAQAVLKELSGTSAIGGTTSSDYVSRQSDALNFKSIGGNERYAAANMFEGYKNRNNGLVSWGTNFLVQGNNNLSSGTRKFFQQIYTGAQTAADIRAQAAQMYGYLANLNGQVLERCLTVVGQLKTQYYEESINKIEKELGSLLAPGKVIGPSVGSQTKEFTVSIGGQEMMVINSQQKVDVELPTEKVQDQILSQGFSAKSMTKLRDTSLVTNANAVGLLSSVSGIDQRLLYNALTVYTEGSKLYLGGDNMQEIKKVLLLKAMSGTGMQGDTFNDNADFMIFYQGGIEAANTKSGHTKAAGNYGFRVISISNYISEIDKSTIDSVAKFTWHPSAPPFGKHDGPKGGRTLADLEAAAQATISVSIKLGALYDIFGLNS